MPLSDKDIARLRAETPACKNLIHFNNAGASLMPDPVYRAITRHLELEREIGGYEAAAVAQDLLQGFYTSFATLLGAEPSEIAFVENATRAWDMAFYAMRLDEGDRIISHASEYASNYLAFLHVAKRRGIEVDLAPSDASGQIDVNRLPSLVTSKTRMINLVHVPTQGGLVNPAEDVGRFAHEHGLVYFLDACQSAGQIELDVGKIGCHVLSGTGRKFLRGPRGSGFLYVSRDILDDLEPPFIDMRAATWTDASTFEYAAGAQRFENWESFVAGRAGLKTAVDYALAIGIAAIEERVTALAGRLRDSLTAIDGIRVRDLGTRKCGIVTFETARESVAALADRLQKSRANISLTYRESAQIDFQARGIEELARASVHYFNTDDEIARFSELVAHP